MEQDSSVRIPFRLCEREPNVLASPLGPNTRVHHTFRGLASADMVTNKLRSFLRVRPNVVTKMAPTEKNETPTSTCSASGAILSDIIEEVCCTALLTVCFSFTTPSCCFVASLLQQHLLPLLPHARLLLLLPVSWRQV